MMESKLKEEDDAFSHLFSMAFSEDSMRELTGKDDLDDVSFAELQVNANEQSVYRLGEVLPNVRELKLNKSVLPSIRDLGTSVRNLRVLWLRESGLTDLDGISVLEQLTELYLSFNSISDVTPLGFHDHLAVLDLEANRVTDVSPLGSCAALRELSLEGNPISRNRRYRQLVHHQTPQIELLDDEPMAGVDLAPLDALTLAQAYDESVSDDEEEDEVGLVSPLASPLRSSAASGGGPHSSSNGSALTHGSGTVFAGNPVLAIRRRRAVLGDDDPTLVQPRVRPSSASSSSPTIQRPSTAGPAPGRHRRGRRLSESRSPPRLADFRSSSFPMPPSSPLLAPTPPSRPHTSWGGGHGGGRPPLSASAPTTPVTSSTTKPDFPPRHGAGANSTSGTDPLAMSFSSTSGSIGRKLRPPRRSTSSLSSVSSIRSSEDDPPLPGGGGGAAETAVTADDESLISLLRRRPSETAAIRSRSKFRGFFKGMPRSRMERLLVAANDHLPSPDRAAKVAKRMALLDGVLV